MKARVIPSLVRMAAQHGVRVRLDGDQIHIEVTPGRRRPINLLDILAANRYRIRLYLQRLRRRSTP